MRERELFKQAITDHISRRQSIDLRVKKRTTAQSRTIDTAIIDIQRQGITYGTPIEINGA